MRYIIIDEFMDVFRAASVSDEVWDMFESGAYLFIIDFREYKVAIGREEWKSLRKYHDIYDILGADK